MLCYIITMEILNPNWEELEIKWQIEISRFNKQNLGHYQSIRTVMLSMYHPFLEELDKLVSEKQLRDIDLFQFRRKWHVDLKFYDLKLISFQSYTPLVSVKQVTSKEDVHIENKIVKNPLPVITVNIDLLHDTKAICKEIEDLVNEYKEKRWNNRLKEKYKEVVPFYEYSKESYIPKEDDFYILKYLFEEERLGEYKATNPESKLNRRADFVSNKLKDNYPKKFEKVDKSRKRCIKLESFIINS
jgi:hypothetical protein